jgi:hypothetical protein
MTRTRSMIIGLAVAAGALAAPAGASALPIVSPPHVNHVFTIVLENENASATFAANSPAPYLSQTLRSKGAYLPNYYGIGHLSLDNYIAMVSGQAPNTETQSDCQFYDDFLPGVPTSDGQYVGQGCVYPNGVGTIANQLEGAGYTWKGYMEDMGTSCRHPAINSQDTTQNARLGDQYAARHNPFVYFHSIIDFPTCAAHDVDFSQLSTDLGQESTTPDYSFITPNLCNDGHDSPCVDGRAGGLPTADAWLQAHVPAILASPAFQNRGMLVITFDEAESGPGGDADASACCNEQPGPNTPNPGGPTVGPGGGKVGAIVLSPCIKPGTTVQTAYNHYSMLRSVEDNFSLPHLGYAGQAGLQPFGTAVLNRAKCNTRL